MAAVMAVSGTLVGMVVGMVGIGDFFDSGWGLEDAASANVNGFCLVTVAGVVGPGATLVET